MPNIPIDLPTINPMLMPIPRGVDKITLMSCVSIILVFTSANKGTINRFTGFANIFSIRWSGDLPATAVAGIAIAVKTPAIVAWMPE